VKSVGKELIEGKLLVVINLQVSYKYYWSSIKAKLF
jgi:hypothetical protein